MENDRVKADAVEETEAVSKLVYLVEYRTTDLDDGKLGGVGGIRRRREDAQITLDLTFGANGIQKAGYCILEQDGSQWRA